MWNMKNILCATRGTPRLTIIIVHMRACACMCWCVHVYVCVVGVSIIVHLRACVDAFMCMCMHVIRACLRGCVCMCVCVGVHVWAYLYLCVGVCMSCAQVRRSNTSCNFMIWCATFFFPVIVTSYSYFRTNPVLNAEVDANKLLPQGHASKTQRASKSCENLLWLCKAILRAPNTKDIKLWIVKKIFTKNQPQHRRTILRIERASRKLARNS